MDKSEIQCLESAYLALLRLPFGATRIENEILLCGLRDALAAALGREPKDVQDEYGVKALSAISAEPVAFQQRVQPWMMACFGPEISADAQERNHRFFEESTELVQACGMTQSEAHQLVDYVYNRPVGEKYQEAGGVMVTLAALCLAQGMDMHAAGETELARIWTKVEKIRAKQAAKPKHSPLPEHVSPLPQAAQPDHVEESLTSDQQHWFDRGVEFAEKRAAVDTRKEQSLPEQAAPGVPEGFALFQHDETGRITCVDAFQLENGWEKHNPRWHRIETASPASNKEALLLLQNVVDTWPKDSDYYRSDHEDAINEAREFLSAPASPSLATERDAVDARQFKPRELVTLNGKQLKDLLDYAWPDRDDEDQADSELTLIAHDTPFKSTEGDDMPAGLYCYCTEYPEEGIILIDEKGSAK